MKLGLFGGCFDPIHYGHIRPVQEARAKLDLDRVVFLPTAVPPHKPGRQFAPPHARFAMVELALLDEPGLAVSPLELTPERPFYTVDSLRHFRQLHGDAELYLLMGGDGFAELHTWKQWQEIVRLAHLVVLTRPDWQWSDFRERVPAELVELAETERVDFITNNPVAVSATEIRQRLADGQRLPVNAVPELVLKYIRKYSLYQ
jgi:nicotinate (nicotinamide) nucleotide adenylyltransferase